MKSKDKVWTQYFGDAVRAKCFAGCGAIINRRSIISNWDQSHLISRFHKGADTIDNLRPVCTVCNRSSQTTHLFDYMKRNHRMPPCDDVYFNLHPDRDPITPRNIIMRKPLEFVLSLHGTVGVLSSCTGSGKTTLAFAIIGKHLAGKILIWITEMNSIINSQFTTAALIGAKNAGLLHDTTVLFSEHLRLCDVFPSNCIIAVTRATALKCYKKVSTDDRFLGFVVDESHHDVPGTETFAMLCDMVPVSKIRLGLTATMNNHRNNKVFSKDYHGGDGDYPPTMLFEYSLVEAVVDSIVRLPKIMFMRVLSAASSITGITNPEKLTSAICDIVFKSATRKGIIWCDNIQAVEFLYKHTRACIPDTIKIIRDHSKVMTTQTYQNDKIFRDAPSDCIMIACYRYRFGVDIRHLSFGIICGSERKGMTTMIQCLGRLTRLEPYDAIFAELMVSMDPETYARDVHNRIADFYEVTNRHCHIEFVYGGGSNTFSLKLNTTTPVYIEFSISDLCDCDFKFSYAEVLNVLIKRGFLADDLEYIYKWIRGLGITIGSKIELILEKTEDSRVSKWWSLAKFVSIDWNAILGITGDYYDFDTAKSVIKKISRTLDIVSSTTLSDVYELIMKIDSRLPPNPVDFYKKKTFRDILQIEYEY